MQEHKLHGTKLGPLTSTGIRQSSRSSHKQSCTPSAFQRRNASLKKRHRQAKVEAYRRLPGGRRIICVLGTASLLTAFMIALVLQSLPNGFHKVSAWLDLAKAAHPHTHPHTSTVSFGHSMLIHKVSKAKGHQDTSSSCFRRQRSTTATMKYWPECRCLARSSMTIYTAHETTSSHFSALRLCMPTHLSWVNDTSPSPRNPHLLAIAEAPTVLHTGFKGKSNWAQRLTLYPTLAKPRTIHGHLYSSYFRHRASVAVIKRRHVQRRGLQCGLVG